MKKFLFIALFLGGIATNSIAQENNFDGLEIELNDRERDDKEEGGGPRGITIIPLQAFISNNVVYLNFIESLESVTITITNLSTGEVICNRDYCNPAVLTFDLFAAESASYVIEIKTDLSLWEGYFNN